MVNITGTYRVYGKYTARNAAYQAEATITRKGEAYHIRWISGPNHWDGLGILQDDVLAVGIFSQNGQAVMCFHVETTKDGLTLSGKWAYLLDDELSVETLIRISGVPIEVLNDGDDRFSAKVN